MDTKTPIHRVSVLLLAAALAVAPACAATAGEHDHVEARELLKRGQIVPLARILEAVRAKVPGDVVEVELEREDGAWQYEVKVLTPAGRVRKLYLDARNASVLRIKDD